MIICTAPVGEWVAAQLALRPVPRAVPVEAHAAALAAEREGSRRAVEAERGEGGVRRGGRLGEHDARARARAPVPLAHLAVVRTSPSMAPRPTPAIARAELAWF